VSDLGPFALEGPDPAPPAPDLAATPAPPSVVLAPPPAPMQLPVDLVAEVEATVEQDTSGMTPTQRRTHSDLLAVGAQRPYTPPKLADQLRDYLREATVPALARWTESSMFLTKAKITSALTCEGRTAAEMQTPWSGKMHPATAVGTIAHRAIQIAHTHPGRPVAEYVQAAITATIRADAAFAEYFADADLGTQSDVLGQATSKVTLFLDSWPKLNDEWTPRFEEPIQVKIGRLTLSARPDLILGRPRHDGRRTVFMCDFKTGSLSERHDTEALFYALVATLRHGVVPFRSAVYSLASAEWVSPELDADTLTSFAGEVARVAVGLVDVLTDARPPELTPGVHCAWCPLAKTCPASSVAEAQEVAETLPVYAPAEF
jgi:hypothetical protein